MTNQPIFYNESHYIRKLPCSHHCMTCKGAIVPGDAYVKIVGKRGKSFLTVYKHHLCHTLHKRFNWWPMRALVRLVLLAGQRVRAETC